MKKVCVKKKHRLLGEKQLFTDSEMHFCKILKIMTFANNEAIYLLT